LIELLISRIQIAFHAEISKDRVLPILTTSDEKENRAFERFGIPVFYGAPNNIPLRHLQTADEFGLSHIISVDGEDFFCSVDGMRKIYQHFCSGGEYAQTTGLPLGLNSRGYGTDFLRRSLAEYRETENLELNWWEIFKRIPVTEISLDSPYSELDSELRLTMDYPEDHEFFQSVVECVGESITRIADAKLLQLIVEKKLYRINSHLNEPYWENTRKLLESHAPHK